MLLEPNAAIDCLTTSDFDAAVQLLKDAQLPTEDLAAVAMTAFLGSKDQNQLVGIVGLEYYGRTALLRSLAVAPSHRGRGLGNRLVQEAQRRAQARGVSSLVLLTQTAQKMFQQLGYCVVQRSAVPIDVRESQEFKALCPDSAVCMTKALIGF